MPLLWLRQHDTIGALGLAINACAERDGHAETVERIGELLRAAQELWSDPSRHWPATRSDSPRSGSARKLLHIADVEALTGA